MFLSNTAIKRPVLTTVILLIVIILGVASYLRLGVELFPDIEFPIIVVNTAYPGAGPEEIERLVTKPIEDNVTLVDNVKFIESYSSEGVSTVMIRLNMGTDLNAAANDVRDEIGRIANDLPDESEEPVVMKFDPTDFPIMRLGLYGDLPLKEIYETADDRIRTELGKIEGVGLIRVVGGEQREIRVSADLNRLKSYGISMGAIIAAIGRANLEMPGGYITKKTTELTVRVSGEVEDVREIESIPIPGSADTTVGDVAQVRDTVADVREKARFMASPSVGIEVLKKGDANTVLVGRRVNEAVTRLNSEVLPSALTLEVVTDDSVFIRDVIREVWANMGEGILLTALALFLFLHNLRGTVIVALVMPAAVVATFTLIYFAGYTVNLMSMMGLAISIGILVNNAILVLENIYRYLDLGEDPKSAAAKGTSEIALAVTGSTLTNVVVFLPIAFMESIVGQMFSQFAVTVVFATICSLVISFTLTPMLASLLMRTREAADARVSERIRRLYRAWDGVFENMTRAYADVVRKVLRHPWKTLGLAVAVFAFVMRFVPPLIGTEMFPRVDEGQFLVEIETDVSRSLHYTDDVTREVEKICAEIPEHEKIYSTVGSVSGGRLSGGQSSVNMAQVVVRLVDKEQRERSTQEVMNELRPKLADVTGADFTVSLQQQGGPGGKPIEMEVRGENYETINSIVADVLKMAAGENVKGVDYEPIEGLVDFESDWRTGKPEISIRPNRPRLERLGVTVQQVVEAVRAAYSGIVASRYREGDDEYDIRVILSEETRNNPERILDLPVMSSYGHLVRLGELAGKKAGIGPVTLGRKDRQHKVTLSGETADVAPGTVADEIDRRMRDYSMPAGYSYAWTGTIELMKENFADLKWAMVLAVVLTFLMLSGILESWKLSILIMLSLPFSFAGVFVALLVAGLTQTIFSMMGMVMLIGLVINNAIVIIDYINVVRNDGIALKEAVVKACAVRLRPLLMANLTTVLAMVPLALGMGAGGEYRAPMAVTQMGGMIAGGTLALVIAPVLYYLAERRKA
ncbi:MAG: efflux RND transporter permease subunit [Kiritimatiellia bacterium]